MSVIPVLPEPNPLLEQLVHQMLYSDTPVIVPTHAALLVRDAGGRLWADLMPVLDPEQDPVAGPYDATLVLGNGFVLAVTAPTRAHLISPVTEPAPSWGLPLARVELVAGYKPTTDYTGFLEELWGRTAGDFHETVTTAAARMGLDPEVLAPPTVRELQSAGRLSRFYVEASTVTIDADGRGWLEDQLVPVAVPEMLTAHGERHVVVEIADRAPYLRVRVPATESWLVTKGEASRLSIGINRLIREGSNGVPDVVSEPGAAPVATVLDDPEAPQSWRSKLARLVTAGR